jgi:hypothetical protein
MMTPLQKLAGLATSWGGALREVSTEEFLKIAGLTLSKQFEGGKIWEGPPRRGFYGAPFTNHDLGVLWAKKQVVYSGTVGWPEVIHEMGHVFACRVNPNRSEEFDFLGWEYALAKYIEGPMDEWLRELRNYQIASDGREFGDLSPSERFKFLQERLEIARQKKLVIGDVPQSIRRK